MSRRLLDGLYGVSGALAALFILAIAALVMAQVVLNIVDRIASLATGSAIGLTIPSYSDFTGFFLAAGSFLALAHTLRAGEHIRVNLLTARLPASASRLVDIVALGIALAATAFLAFHTGALVLESLEYGDLSSGMVAVPIWIPQASLVIGLSILAIALADTLQARVRGEPMNTRDAMSDAGPSSQTDSGSGDLPTPNRDKP